RIRFADPAGGRAGNSKRFLVNRSGDLPNVRNRTNWRYAAQRPVDRALGFFWHEIAAVGVRADRQAFALEVAEAMCFSAAHVTFKGRLVVETAGQTRHGRAKLRSRRFANELLDDSLVLVESAVDARQLVNGNDVGA